MKLVLHECSNHDDEGTHTHWAIRSKRMIITGTLWGDWERRSGFGTPIELMIDTPRREYLVRPFCKSQRWDWAEGKWADYTDDKNWGHIVSSPQTTERWLDMVGRWSK
jgi:hypothetical protein